MMDSVKMGCVSLTITIKGVQVPRSKNFDENEMKNDSINVKAMNALN